jgi:hypothetical protein
MSLVESPSGEVDSSPHRVRQAIVNMDIASLQGMFPKNPLSSVSPACTNNVNILCIANTRDRDGCSPLSAAIDMNWLVGVQLLVKCGANVKHRGKGGRTPLMQARESVDQRAGQNYIDDRARIVEILLAGCAQFNSGVH